MQQAPAHVSGPNAAKRLDICVWGSTGVVGRLVAEHLARDYQKQGVKWALAGRNRQKLESIRDKLCKIDPSVKDVPIITADLADPSSLESLTRQAKVVLATVGPYREWGTPMVEACVNTGTHYCDITGEAPWVRRMISKYDAHAKQKGVRIVHMAGFDSIPSDLTTFLAADHMKKKHNKECGKVEVHVKITGGAVSGGTVASLFGSVFDESGPERKALSDPYGLDPPSSSRGPDKPDSFWAGFSRLHNTWHMPFIMAPINSRVVRRSNALMGHRYGKNFSYSEAQNMSGRFAAYIGSCLFIFIGLMISIRPLRRFWMWLLPAAGQMPDRKQMEDSSFLAVAIATSDETGGGKPVAVRAEFKAWGDPGFLATSRMLLESGLCIALEEEELMKSAPLQAGVLTPAAAFGHILVKRLNKQSQMFNLAVADN